MVGDFGQPVQDATVTMTRYLSLTDALHYRDAISRGTESATTNSRGFFGFISMQPGYYVLHIRAEGEYDYCASRLLVQADALTSVKIHVTAKRLLVRCAPAVLVKPTQTTGVDVDPPGVR